MHSEPVAQPFVKRAETPEDIARLRDEAAILRHVAQPGVVELRGQRFTPSFAEIVLAPVNGTPLSETPLEAHRLAATMTTLAMVVSRLHERHVAHHNITGSSILVSRNDGRPVLTAFGKAEAAGQLSQESVVADVRALNELLSERLLAIDTSDNPNVQAVANRLTEIAVSFSSKSDDDIAGAREWAALVRKTTAETEPVRRPAGNTSAKRVASREVMVDDTPKASLTPAERLAQLRQRQPQLPPAVSRYTAPVTRHISFKSVAKLLASIAVVSVLFGGLARLTGNEAVAVDPTVPDCPARGDAPLVFDVDGDGCGDSVTLGLGTVAVNNEVFTVGSENDLLAIGRWNCTDRRTLALMRPDSGELFIFDDWPKVGQNLAPRLIDTTPGALGISAEPSGECDRVAITSLQGIKVIDPLEPEPTTTTTAAKRKR